MLKALTSKTVNALVPGEKPFEVRDTTLPGFLLRVQPSGSMTYYVAYRNQTGKKNRYKLGSHPVMSAPMAREEAKRKLAEVVMGEDPQAEKKEARRNITLEQFLDLHYGPWAEVNLKSYSPTMARLRSGFAPLMNKYLSELTAWDFEKHRQVRLKNKLGKSIKEPGQATINRDQATMRAALSRAVQWGHLDSNPLEGVKKAKEDRNRKIRALESEEETRMLNYLRQERKRWKLEFKRLEVMIILSIDTGVRRGELFGLKWSDVDAKAQTLHVRGEGAKSSQSRTIPLSPRCVSILTAWKAQSGAEGLVFPGEAGEKLDNVTKAWKRLLDKAEVCGLRWHDLRHTFGTRLANAGVPLPTVQRLMGHASIVTTQRYLHSTDQDARKAIEMMAEATDIVTVPQSKKKHQAVSR